MPIAELASNQAECTEALKIVCNGVLKSEKRPDEMSELEKLRAEVKILKAEKERAEMEASFLKKLEEIERRRG